LYQHDSQGYNVIGADITIGEPIKALGGRAEQLDVASPESIQAFKQKLGDQPVDLLLNIAGKSNSLGYESVESNIFGCI
jgi:hypothetical protein